MGAVRRREHGAFPRSRMKIAFIRWWDACSVEAAEPNTPASPELTELRAAGFVLAESDTAVLVGLETCGDGTPGRWRLNIPKVNIIERFDTDIPGIAESEEAK